MAICIVVYVDNVVNLDSTEIMGEEKTGKTGKTGNLLPSSNERSERNFLTKQNIKGR